MTESNENRAAVPGGTTSEFKTTAVSQTIGALLLAWSSYLLDKSDGRTDVDTLLLVGLVLCLGSSAGYTLLRTWLKIGVARGTN